VGPCCWPWRRSWRRRCDKKCEGLSVGRGKEDKNALYCKDDAACLALHFQSCVPSRLLLLFSDNRYVKHPPHSLTMQRCPLLSSFACLLWSLSPHPIAWLHLLLTHTHINKSSSKLSTSCREQKRLRRSHNKSKQVFQSVVSLTHNPAHVQTTKPASPPPGGMAYSKPPGGGGAAPWATPQEEEARVRREEGRERGREGHDDGGFVSAPAQVCCDAVWLSVRWSVVSNKALLDILPNCEVVPVLLFCLSAIHSATTSPLPPSLPPSFLPSTNSSSRPRQCRGRSSKPCPHTPCTGPWAAAAEVRWQERKGWEKGGGDGRLMMVGVGESLPP